MNKSFNKPINSLFSQSVCKVVENLPYYINNNYGSIVTQLPSHIKTKILNRFTSSSYFWKDLDLNYVLSLLIDPYTKRVDLTSFHVDDAMLDVLRNCSNLRKLYILRVGDHSISTLGLLKLIPNIPNVYLLTLANCAAVTDIVIEQLAQSCPNLSGLDVGGCRNVTDKSLEALAGLENLLWLTLSKTNITNDGIEVLLQGKSAPRMKELRIADCLHVTDKILTKVASCCPDLEVLIFYNKYNKSDVSEQTSCQFEELRCLKQLTWTINW